MGFLTEGKLKRRRLLNFTFGRQKWQFFTPVGKKKMEGANVMNCLRVLLKLIVCFFKRMNWGYFRVSIFADVLQQLTNVIFFA